VKNCAVLVLIIILMFSQWARAGAVQDQSGLEVYRDSKYGYAFQYPPGWDLRKLPEGAANDDVRVLLQTPNGNSFMVVVEKGRQNPSKADFQSDPNRQAYVDKLIQQTTQQVYRTVGRNLGAVESKIGERTDLSNDRGIRFYVSTLHKMKAGDPVVVAGIHCYPFSRPYSISFMMTALFDRGAEKDNAVMTAVFNSFQLLNGPADTPGGPTPTAPSNQNKAQ
jgi:hypothetical protein